MNDDQVGTAALLDSIDLARDEPQIVQTLSSMLKAPDYPQLFSSFHGEDGQPPPEKAVKFVDALDKARVPSPPLRLVFHDELTPYTFRHWDTMMWFQKPRIGSTEC